MKVTSTFMPIIEANLPKKVVEVNHVRMGATVESGLPGRLIIAINHDVTLDFGVHIETLRRFAAQTTDAINKLEAQRKAP